MCIAELATISVERLAVQRLGVGVLTLILEQVREVADGVERLWMRIAELATTTFERFAVQHLRVVVLALLIEIRARSRGC